MTNLVHKDDSETIATNDNAPRRLRYRKFYNLSTTTSRNVFNGNGVTTAFPLDFAFIASTSLQVTLVAADGTETPQVENTHYTVSGGLNSDGEPNTGTVTMVAAPASGARLVVERTEGYVQPSTFQRFGRIPIKVVELALDRVTLLAQQLLDLSNRTLRYPVSESLATSGTLPSKADRLGQILGFDSVTGAPVAVPNNGGSTAVTATGSTTPRFLADRMAEVFNAKDYGAVGDGVTNDAAAIQAAIDAAEAAGGGVVLLPKGTCKINTWLTIQGHNIALRGYGRRVSTLDASAITTTPAIDVGDAVTSFMFPRIEGLWINAPAGQPVIRARKVARPTFQDIYLDGIHTGIQLGSGADADFVSEVTLRDIEGDIGQTPHGNGIEVKGATGVLDNVRLEGWAVGTGNQTAGMAGLLITANSGQKATDGLQVVNCGFGLFPIGFKILGDVTTFVVQVANSFFDRCYTSAVDMAFPNGATASIIKFVNNHFQGGTGLGAANGVQVVQSGTGTASIIQFTGNHISGFDNRGLSLGGTLTKLSFVGNVITNIAVANVASWDGVSIGNAVEGVFAGNIVDSSCRYCWNLGDSLNLAVRSNLSKGFGTGAVFTNAGVAGVNRVIEANGDGRKRRSQVGPFTFTNLAAGATNAVLSIGATTTYFPGFRGRVAGINAILNDTVTADSVTFKPSVTGTVSTTLSAAIGSGSFSGSGTQNSNDFFTNTDRLSVVYTTGAGFTPSGSADATVFLEIEEY